MVANHHFTRVDTIELKDLIYQKIGHQQAEKYFDQLKRFFSSKLSKIDFDRSCIQTIGRENISLHNRLVRSLIQNACVAKIPPQKARKVERLDVKVASGCHKNYLQSLYGDAFAQSPRKCRSPVNRKFRDHPSPLGPLGKSPSTTCEETVTRIQESATELHSLCSRPPVGVASVEDGEEVEQVSVRRWSDVSAPLGVEVNSRKRLRCGYTYKGFGDSCKNSGGLPDTGSLRSRLEKKLALEGFGVSMDCANMLNSGLDVFLKRLIEPCVGLAGSRCRDLERQSNDQMTSGLNGTRFGQTRTQPKSVSLLDFRVAMESNPRLLGEDWSLQLEKICQYAALGK